MSTHQFARALPSVVWLSATLAVTAEALPPALLTNLPHGYTQNVIQQFSQTCSGPFTGPLNCVTTGGDPLLVQRGGTSLDRAGNSYLQDFNNPFQLFLERLRAKFVAGHLLGDCRHGPARAPRRAGDSAPLALASSAPTSAPERGPGGAKADVRPPMALEQPKAPGAVIDASEDHWLAAEARPA